jgi:glycosyltransferase involved in cell wall biosynthesis
LLLIPHLGGGGAEKVVEQLARGLSTESYEVHIGLVTTTKRTTTLPTTVIIHALGASRVRWSGLKILRLVSRIQPQLILSGIAHLNFLVLFLRPFFPPGTKVLIRQNTTIYLVLRQGKVPFYTRLLYQWLYRYADRILCQSDAMAADLLKTLHLNSNKVSVLLNPIQIPGKSTYGSPQSGNCLQLLAVGRLAHEKGFDLLLTAFAALHPEFPQLRLRIAGEGPESMKLLALSRTLQIEKYLVFTGFIDAPFSDAQIFVLSSRFEGMPNSLLEAAAHGLPIISTPCSDGVVQLLQNQPGVWLSESTTAEALARTLRDAILTLQPGQRYMHQFIDPFRYEKAIAAFERLIDEELSR